MRIWDMAGSTLKKPIRGRRMGVGALNGLGNVLVNDTILLGGFQDHPKDFKPLVDRGRRDPFGL